LGERDSTHARSGQPHRPRHELLYRIIIVDSFILLFDKTNLDNVCYSDTDTKIHEWFFPYKKGAFRQIKELNPSMVMILSRLGQFGKIPYANASVTNFTSTYN
jgi:hypothetical protein